MIKVLMNKTFFELDYEFYQKYPEVANACGCTGIVAILVERKAYVFSVGDCKGYLFRN
jgi:serine/threonine protein phosphatase PrpC